MAVLILFLTGGFQRAVARDDTPGEYQVKAAFIYNFSKFVEWPDRAFLAPADPMVIGVLGHDPFGSALDLLEGKTVKGRNIAVRRIADIHNIGPCQILFISQSENGHLEEIMTEIKNTPILLIGDTEPFLQHGGMINFIAEESRVGFEINNSAARRAGLRISSQLLKLAKRVVN